MSSDLLDVYRAIEDSSRRMLDAARQEDWDMVMRLEGACAVLIEQLRVQGQLQELDALERGEKSRIMQRILHNDAEIRNITEPVLDDLARELPEIRQRWLH